MTPETLTTTAEIFTTIAQILPYTALAITRLIKAIKALHNLVSKPRGRHRQIGKKGQGTKKGA